MRNQSAQNIRRPSRPLSSPVRHPAALPYGARARRAIALILLTLFIPGSAQLAAGNRSLGRLAFRFSLVVLLVTIIGLVTYFLTPTVFFSALTQTWPLLIIVMGIFIVAIGWAALFVDSWRLALAGRPPWWSGGLASILTVALIAGTAGPLVYLGQLLTAHRQVIGQVFDSGTVTKPTKGRFNVLLIGGDAGAGRTSLRNDTMILLSVDADTGQAVQIGIPRNLERTFFPPTSPMAAEFPDGFVYPDGDPKLYAVYRYAAERPTLYPGKKDPGAAAVVDAVSYITGLTVQYHILVDMAGFEALIDALGGVQIQVNKRVPKATTVDKSISAWIEPGAQKMDGETALWFARSRVGANDYERMARQRCVIDAAMNQLDPATVVRRYTEIARTSPDLVRTDIPQRQLATFSDIALKMRGKPIVNLPLTPPEINTGNPDFGKIRRLVREAIAQPAQAAAPQANQDVQLVDPSAEAGQGTTTPAPTNNTAPPKPPPAEPAHNAPEPVCSAL